MTSNPVVSQKTPVPTTRIGIADIVGFGVDGVVILRNSVNIQSVKVISDFGYDAGGWRVDKHVRLVADTTGNRQSDVIGFGDAGVYISFNNGNNTFQGPKMAIQDFAYNAGNWRIEKHLRFVADIRNTGYADIVGFGDAGVLVSLNNGKGTFAPGQLAVDDFGYDAGSWRIEKHLRFLGDVYGTGLLDIIGFGENNVLVGKNNGNGTFNPGQAVVENDLTYSGGGWRIEKHPRFVSDLTGQGRVDLIGFGDAGVQVALNNGDGTFQAPKLVLEDFGYNAGGWRVEKNPRFIADLTGNKAGDIVGFGNEGVYIAINNGDGTFQAAKKVIDDFNYDAGWRVEKHPRFAVDVTGDGCADIIGFGENAVYVSFNNGRGEFEPVRKLLTDFAYNDGKWSEEKTVRLMANLYAF